ncbi:MAG: ATP12 family protein [Alphaproteobacteria bacterium]|jgi:chaperone required for assembly of F1-ATPase
MSWKLKRFWQECTVRQVDGGYTVLLDDRPVKTPGKLPLVVPTLAMAQAIAAEWDAQHGPIRPQTMPYTRAANSALEKVAPQFDEVVALLAAYGDSDLLCYRAPGPVELTTLQAQAWDPLLQWAQDRLNTPLTVTTGVIHVPQPEASLNRLHHLTRAHSHFQTAAFHDLVSLSGSLILAFAITHDHLSPEQAWTLSRIDETYQNSLWGADDEAAALAETKRLAFHQAARFWAVC